MNYHRSAVDDAPTYPLDTPPKPSESGRSDNRKTNDTCMMHEAAEPACVAGAPVLGSANVLAPPRKHERGHSSWERLYALVVAVEALLGASMVSEARPLLSQLRSIVEAGRGPSASS